MFGVAVIDLVDIDFVLDDTDFGIVLEQFSLISRSVPYFDWIELIS
jgi:hypothetical protein